MKAPYYLVRGARYALGMNIKEAAKAIGVSTTTIVKAERGDEIRVSSWLKIAKYYNLEKHVDYDDAVIAANTSAPTPKTRQSGGKEAK